MAFYGGYNNGWGNPGPVLWWKPRSEEERKKFESYKSDVKTFLTISKEGVPVRGSYNQMKEYMEGELPYQDIGFKNFGEFLFHCQDVLQVRTDSANGFYIFLKGFADEQTEHLRQLVSGQAKAKSKRGFTPTVKNTRSTSPKVLLDLLTRPSHLMPSLPKPAFYRGQGGRRGGGRGGSRGSYRHRPIIPRFSAFTSGGSVPVLRPYVPSQTMRPGLMNVVMSGLAGDSSDEENDGRHWFANVDCKALKEKNDHEAGFYSDGEDVVDCRVNGEAGFKIPEEIKVTDPAKVAVKLVENRPVASKPPPVLKPTTGANSSLPKKPFKISIPPLKTVSPVPVLRPYVPPKKVEGTPAPAIATVKEKCPESDPGKRSIPQPYPNNKVIISGESGSASVVIPVPKPAPRTLAAVISKALAPPAVSAAPVKIPKLKTWVPPTAQAVPSESVKTSVEAAVPPTAQAVPSESVKTSLEAATPASESSTMGPKVIYYQSEVSSTSPEKSSVSNTAPNPKPPLIAKTASVPVVPKTLKTQVPESKIFRAALAALKPIQVPVDSQAIKAPPPKPITLAPIPTTTTTTAQSQPLGQVLLQPPPQSPPPKTPDGKDCRALEAASSPSKILSQRLQVIRDKPFNAILIGVDSFGFLVIQLDISQIDESFKKQREEMCKFYSSDNGKKVSRLSPEEFEVGLIVAARINGNNGSSYYVRARIFETGKSHGFCLVLDLDEHEFFVVELRNMYRLENRFHKPLPKSIMCRLADIPDEVMMTDELTEAFEATADLCPPNVKVTFIEDDDFYNVPVVSLLLVDTGKDVATLIKQYGGSFLKPVPADELPKRRDLQLGLRDSLVAKKYLLKVER